MGFVQRKGKQLVPTKDGINLAVVLPESLTSPALTAEWENRLTEIAKGNADPDEFMAEIEAQVRQLVKTYSCISADKQNLFQSERVIIGKCPRCSENVYKGKKNFYCGNRSCQFVMWKNDRFFEQRKRRSHRRSPPLCSKTVRQRSRASIPKRQAKPMMQRCFWQIREASTSITG